MAWRNPLGSFWRRSPYTSLSNPPRVSDSDYTYLTPEDIVEPPSERTYVRPHTDSSDTEPDTLLLRHRKNSYRLQFPAYAIDDGMLSVGQLRERAAEATNTPHSDRVKLLYKGRLLDDDSLPCRAEGLKQNSEVLCVVSEVEPEEGTPSDISSSGAEKANGSAHQNKLEQGDYVAKGKGRKGKKKNQRKNKSSRIGQPGDTECMTPPIMQRPSSSGRSSAPLPAPALGDFHTALERINALGSYFRSELLPFCDEFIANPPADPKVRDFEYKRRSETVLAQVILKADGIDPTGDEEARSARRALIKETQATLSRLDQAAKA